MTQLAEPVVQGSPDRGSQRHGDERTGRWAVIILMIVALVGCGLTGGWASDWKDVHSNTQAAVAERGALSGMSSYALALMLGGLRGPLVMVLWSKVENQKIDRDLEDVDTMIEWIRLLQPEFDTVHIFQIWNKAYNISALMAGAANKYTTILDAADYGRRVDRDRPNNVNILDQLARVFAEKLGGVNVAERGFYNRQFRLDSMTDANREKAFADLKRTPRMGLKFLSNRNGPILDEQNNLLPELLTPRTPRPAGLDPKSDWNDGSELQYLAKLQPFPDGVPPLALGYNYAKRAQVAMTVGGQKPVQLSESVLSSYPALVLMQWAQVEQDRAVINEAAAFGIKLDVPNLVAAARLNPADATLTNPHAMESAAYGFDLSARLASESIREYERHNISAYVNPYMTYHSQVDEMRALQFLSSANRDYAKAFLPGADKTKLLQQAWLSYRQAWSSYERIALTYYVEAGIIPKIFKNNEHLDQLTDQQLDRLFAQYEQAVKAVPAQQQEYADQRLEFDNLIGRCLVRIAQLGAYGPGSAPAP